jgi:Protein of unknown function (DUF429)
VIGFGLDLAGYTTKKTSLAAIDVNGKIATVTLLRHSAFAPKRATTAPLELVVREETNHLERCIKLGPVAVDIPIDLQGLPYPTAAKEIWELTKRPIDKKLGAMAPFADRIGAPVARFAAIKRCGKLGTMLGKNLFETYPTAIWQKLGIIPGEYKSLQKEKAKVREDACAALCKSLKIEQRLTNDDDIDAIICAVTAVAPTDHLCEAEEYGVDRVPVGFRLLKRNPFEAIHVSEGNFFEWIDRRERSR